VKADGKEEQIQQLDTYHSRMKHLSIKEGFIYNNIKSGQVNIIYMTTTDNLADFLTKAVSAIKLCGYKNQAQHDHLWLTPLSQLQTFPLMCSQ